ncbi:hypothetical protein [Faecalibacillus faecis]|uniref:hypothetical protein n=1 Tax=Faecalibacillus faecis TaxID=1982628 RepID=UPI00386416A9
MSNEERKEQLLKNIENWEKELNEVWRDTNTDAAEVERRNLRNLIYNARREIDEIDGVVQENLDEIDPEKLLNNLKNEKENNEVSKNRFKLSIERLKEEREDYKDNKDLYDEYTKKINETEKELEELENKEKSSEEIDKNLRILTKGRMQQEAEKRKIESEIRRKLQEISEIQYDTEQAMEEVTLSSGEKANQPKVLRLYSELDKLRAALQQRDTKISEYQDVIDDIKGIDKSDRQTKDFTPEEIRYFHGQGDLREYGGENGEDTRNNRLANDEYFGLRGGRNNGVAPSQPTPPEPTPTPPDPTPTPTQPTQTEEIGEPKEFDEILEDIQAAQNAMSDAEVGRYESARGKWLVPVKYDKGDWLHNSARFLVQKVLGSIVNVPRKIYSMIRTGKEQEEKMNNITENVNNLSDQDFQTLLEGLQSYEGHENKVSASVRKAVTERAKREMRETNQARNIEIHESLTTIRTNYDRSTKIQKLLEDDSLISEERTALESEKQALDSESSGLVRKVEKLRKEGALLQGGAGTHGLEEESKAAREGSNLSGRKFARRFSANAELQKQQAELKRQQREARQSGDTFAEVDAFVRREELLEANTETKKIMGITVSRSDRHHETGVFRKEYKEDDLARNIATIAAVTATTVNIIKQIRNQALLTQKNSEIQQANVQNTVMANKGEGLRQGIIGNDQVVKKGIAATNDTRTGAAWAAGHEHAGAASDFTNNWGHTNLDQTFHQIMSGTVDDNTLKSFIQQGLPVIKQYAATHPQYNYNALISALNNLENGGVEAISQYNNAMQTLIQNAIQTGKITSTSVGTLSLSPTYVETLIPLVLAGKAVTSKEYRKAEKEADRKEKREKKIKEKLGHIYVDDKKIEEENMNVDGKTEKRSQDRNTNEEEVEL